MDGARVTRPEQPDAAWLAAHEWRWDPARLDEIIAEAAGQGVPTLWMCGRAANLLRLADRFDAAFLLEIDQETMRTGMGSPRRGNDFGRVGDTLAAALASHTPFVAVWRRYGAVRIDATAGVDTVAQELLMAAGLAALRRPERGDCSSARRAVRPGPVRDGDRGCRPGVLAARRARGRVRPARRRASARVLPTASLTHRNRFLAVDTRGGRAGHSLACGRAVEAFGGAVPAALTARPVGPVGQALPNWPNWAPLSWANRRQLGGRRA